MKEIRHQLIESFFHYLQCFIPPRWCKIFSINRSSWDVAMIRIQNTVTYLTVRPPSWMAPEPAGDPSSYVMYFDLHIFQFEIYRSAGFTGSVRGSAQTLVVHPGISRDIGTI